MNKQKFGAKIVRLALGGGGGGVYLEVNLQEQKVYIGATVIRCVTAIGFC